MNPHAKYWFLYRLGEARRNLNVRRKVLWRKTKRGWKRFAVRSKNAYRRGKVYSKLFFRKCKRWWRKTKDFLHDLNERLAIPDKYKPLVLAGTAFILLLYLPFDDLPDVNITLPFSEEREPAEVKQTVEIVGARSITANTITLSDAEIREHEKEIQLYNLRTEERRKLSEYANPEMEKLIIVLAREVGFPENQIENVLRHAFCESGWNPRARNNYRGGHFGFMQIQVTHRHKFGANFHAQSVRKFREAMFDPKNNLELAYELWEDDLKNPMFKDIRDGFGPWKATLTCRKKSTYKGVPWNQIITVYKYGEPVTIG